MTPFVDELADRSVVFTNANSHTSFTGTSVSTMLSGLLPETHGLITVDHKLSSNVRMMQHAFKQAGYQTTCISASLLISSKTGISDGFEIYQFLRSAEEVDRNRSTTNLDRMEKTLQDIATDSRPKFIYFHYLAPHSPYHPPAPFDSRFISGVPMSNDDYAHLSSKLARGQIDPDDEIIQKHYQFYRNNLAYADYLLERTVKKLQQLGMYEDSLIIFTSDHGEAFGEHRTIKHYHTVYDEQIHVPLFYHHPSLSPGVVTTQVGHVDLFPTIARMANLDVDESVFQGQDYSALLFGGQIDPLHYYARSSHPLLRFAVRGERYKYVHSFMDSELYDIKADPLELKDLSKQLPSLTALMRLEGFMIIQNNKLLNEKYGVAVIANDIDEELRNLGYIN
jgi:arylsulfatase A-like enzyme